jgi:hypothetical protein
MEIGSKATTGIHRVVHPLDDVRERKIDVSAAGPIAMTISVRVSLLALRGYLLLMMGLVMYRFVSLCSYLLH